MDQIKCFEKCVHAVVLLRELVISRRCAACSHGAQSGCRPHPCRAAPPGTGSRSGKCSSSTPCGCCCLQCRGSGGNRRRWLAAAGMDAAMQQQQQGSGGTSSGNRHSTTLQRCSEGTETTAGGQAALRCKRRTHLVVQLAAVWAEAAAWAPPLPSRCLPHKLVSARGCTRKLISWATADGGAERE